MARRGAPGRAGLAALSGLVLAAAFPRLDASPLVFMSLVPLLAAAHGASPRAAAVLGMVAGVLFFGILLEWIRIFDSTGWVLLVALHAAYIAAFAWLLARLRPRAGGWPSLLLAASAWTALEWLRSVGPCALTWGGLAYALHRFPPLVQLASVTGPFGLSFLVALANAAIAEVVLDRAGRKGAAALASVRRLTLVAALLGGAWAWGAWRLGQPFPEGRTARVALVQASLGEEGVRRVLTPEALDEALRTYLDLTETAAAGRPDIVIWPESSVPVALREKGASAIRDALQQMAARLRADLVMGAGYRDTAGNPRNSAYLFTPDGQLAGRYDKVHLVPFGEYTPFRRQLGFLYRHFPIITRDFAPGQGFYPLPAETAPLGVAICFESSFPGIARTLRREGARLLVVITNDAWFGVRSATWQHYRMAAFRAVENGCYLARAAATGFSAILDPCGREIARTDLMARAVIQGDVRLSPAATPYLALGDWVVLGSILFLGASVLARRRPLSERGAAARRVGSRGGGAAARGER
ncbi:MAG: apolipoprotein N-acyltransferase [Armatimonadetes bacterium]|nr:apolipoprotein N-acyltransferase [Armatimonadota bacterium]